MNLTLRQRYRGCLLGLAAGDALGTTLEFSTPGDFEPLTDRVGGGPFNLEAGEWTDDTSMALCLAESLVEEQIFDPKDQMHRYLNWYRCGYLSPTGECFDIGSTVSASLRRFELNQDPFAGLTDSCYGGNGSLMRLAPVPLAFAGSPKEAIRLSGEMSRTTHAAPEPIDACRYYSGLIIAALAGVPKQEFLESRYRLPGDAWPLSVLSPNIDEIAAGSFKIRQPPDICGIGYVVKALEAALWAFWHTEDFESGALAAVNLGNDADTTGAIYGQLAGAYYGQDAIPERWRSRLAMRERIIALADGLFGLSQSSRSELWPVKLE